MEKIFLEFVQQTIRNIKNRFIYLFIIFKFGNSDNQISNNDSSNNNNSSKNYMSKQQPRPTHTSSEEDKSNNNSTKEKYRK